MHTPNGNHALFVRKKEIVLPPKAIHIRVFLWRLFRYSIFGVTFLGVASSNLSKDQIYQKVRKDSHKGFSY